MLGGGLHVYNYVYDSNWYQKGDFGAGHKQKEDQLVRSWLGFDPYIFFVNMQMWTGLYQCIFVLFTTISIAKGRGINITQIIILMYFLYGYNIIMSKLSGYLQLAVQPIFKWNKCCIIIYLHFIVVTINFYVHVAIVAILIVWRSGGRESQTCSPHTLQICDLPIVLYYSFFKCAGTVFRSPCK